MYRFDIKTCNIETWVRTAFYSVWQISVSDLPQKLCKGKSDHRYLCGIHRLLDISPRIRQEFMA